jgi:hypothetical protein
LSWLLSDETEGCTEDNSFSHCERSEAIQGVMRRVGLLRRSLLAMTADASDLSGRASKRRPASSGPLN